jgi:hypothetical protein
VHERFRIAVLVKRADRADWHYLANCRDYEFVQFGIVVQDGFFTLFFLRQDFENAAFYARPAAGRLYKRVAALYAVDYAFRIAEHDRVGAALALNPQKLAH